MVFPEVVQGGALALYVGEKDLEQWFTTRGNFVLRGTSSNIWKHFYIFGCYLWDRGREWGCH